MDVKCKRALIERVIKCVNTGGSWDSVALKVGFSSGEELRKYAETECKSYFKDSKYSFRHVDETAKKNARKLAVKGFV